MRKSIINQAVTTIRRTVASDDPTSDPGKRRYVTPAEAHDLVRAARAAGPRQGLVVLLAYRHGLRATELLRLHWEDVDLSGGTIYVRRIKRGLSGAHPLQGDELRWLRAWQREQKPTSPLIIGRSRRWLHLVVRAAGEAAGLALPVHPHMLRHGCGYALAAQGIDTRTIQAYLGHAAISSTVRYTEISPERFRAIQWREE